MQFSPAYPDFQSHDLGDGHCLWEGRIPGELHPDTTAFEALWDLHPEQYHEVRFRDKVIKTPRWQQAYNRDYVYTGSRNSALPVPSLLQPYWDWAQEAVDERLNGLLLNWYDGEKDHYIGKHRDTVQQLVDGSPIVTISLGQERVFRLRPWKKPRGGFTDFPALDGTVFVLPYATNLTWTHEVPKSTKFRDRRISITIRAFHDDPA